MAKRIKKEIWMQVGNYPAQYIETVANQEVAEARIKTYERMDRYEIDVEGYSNTLPTYEIR